MSKGASDKITYKPYNQDERWLLLPILEELVPENHLVRVVNKVIDEMDIEKYSARTQKAAERASEICMTWQRVRMHKRKCASVSSSAART